MTVAKQEEAPEGAELDSGVLAFTVETRIIRELGERLVRQPEIAVLELIKNAHDADALVCRIEQDEKRIVVTDDGSGMTFEEFANGWMRIGTSGKGKRDASPRFNRQITGEKGIGRFAVRHLGGVLALESTAFDKSRNQKTRLRAEFDWDRFDVGQTIEKVAAPYTVFAAADDAPTGVTLTVTRLKEAAARINWKAVRTGSMGVVTAVRSLLRDDLYQTTSASKDLGFQLLCPGSDAEEDVARTVLGWYALRAVVELRNGRLKLDVFQGGEEKPYLEIRDAFEGEIGDVYADIRFLPRREGAFANKGVEGRTAYAWVRENAGVKVFDRNFQITPYGMPGDDWLTLTGDAARNLREPRSNIMAKHYPMEPAVKADTKLNWMLRLPEDKQLIGVVQVNGRRESEGHDRGLIPSADREGFIDNADFQALTDLIRGAVEAIAFADRDITLKAERKAAEEKLKQARTETKKAIADIERDRELTSVQRDRIVQVLEATQERFEREQSGGKERQHQLEVMSLLGVVAGFMTHEFGAALSELRAARKDLEALAKKDPAFADRVSAFDKRIEALKSFVRYSRAYVEGAKAPAAQPFPARPRFNHVIRTFGSYAEKRRIDVEIEVDPDVLVPPVPPSLYDGIAQNLYTNALKALTASTKESDRRIVIRAWNDPKFHFMQVSDTGVGIPSSIKSLVFDPLFTTTDNRDPDPLGSGMGLGLALVRRGAEAFGGVAGLVEPPPGFTTCVEVKLPRDAA